MPTIPFTRDEFLGVFAAYNSATWPAAIISYLLALAILFGAWRGGPASRRLVDPILALMWAWVGAIYHGIYFGQINPAARLFAAAFIFQAALFVVHTNAPAAVHWRQRSRVRTNAGAVLILYAMVLYPLIGLFSGESYPAMPLFGTAPCPLLMFTLGVLLWSDPVRWWLWVIPLLWSIVGGYAVVALQVQQDWALPAGALLVVAILQSEWLASRRPAAPA